MVRKHPANIEGQNGMPRLSKTGIRINIGSDGITNQKVAIACTDRRSGSCVSRHSQIIPKTEISGSDAISPPRPGNFLATSDTVATIMPEITALMIR